MRKFDTLLADLHAALYAEDATNETIVEAFVVYYARRANVHFDPNKQDNLSFAIGEWLRSGSRLSKNAHEKTLETLVKMDVGFHSARMGWQYQGNPPTLQIRALGAKPLGVQELNGLWIEHGKFRDDEGQLEHPFTSVAKCWVTDMLRPLDPTAF